MLPNVLPHADSDHIPVLADEVRELLAVRPGETVVDATFGAGGYTRAILAGADASGVVAVAKVRQLDAAHRNADQVLAFLADQFTLGEELAQVLPDPALDDLPETLVIFFDLQYHVVKPRINADERG